MNEEKRWQSTISKSIGYGMAMAIMLIAQHFWNNSSTQSVINTHAENTRGVIESSKADTDRVLGEMQRQFEDVKNDNARLRSEADDRQRIINSLKLDVAELKKICGIKQISAKHNPEERGNNGICNSVSR